MSSKFLERLDEIREGAPPRLGFGTRRPEKTPGMALIVSAGEHSELNVAESLSPDAIIVADAMVTSRYDSVISSMGPDNEQIMAITRAASGASWGVRTEGLSVADAAAWREAGADPIVFSLSDTALGAVTSKDAARVLVVDSGLPPEELRDINPLPVDAVLVSLPGDPAGWTLADLSAVARVSGRVGKHLLAEVSGDILSLSKDGDTLEALRNAGVAGLVVGLSLGEEAISGLKDALLNMPRPGADRRSRSSAILPGSVYTARRPAPAEDDPDDDD